MALLGNKLGTWRLAWTRESPLRDYMWGAIIVAFGLFTNHRDGVSIWGMIPSG